MNTSPIRVAVVEDDKSVRNALRRLLTTSNFETDIFASAREFLASVAASRPHCLIADLKMPEMGGLELLRKIPECAAGLPVIIVTAFDTPESRLDCKALGAVAYLCKPVQEDVLLSAIAAATGSGPPGRRDRHETKVQLRE